MTGPNGVGRPPATLVTMRRVPSFDSCEVRDPAAVGRPSRIAKRLSGIRSGKPPRETVLSGDVLDGHGPGAVCRHDVTVTGWRPVRQPRYDATPRQERTRGAGGNRHLEDIPAGFTTRKGEPPSIRRHVELRCRSKRAEHHLAGARFDINARQLQLTVRRGRLHQQVSIVRQPVPGHRGARQQGTRWARRKRDDPHLPGALHGEAGAVP